MFTVKLIATRLSKTFGTEIILNDFSYEFHSGHSYALLGGNGSGKSTLLQMLSGFMTPGKGKVEYFHSNKQVDESKRFEHVAVCAPYLELVEELTLNEFFQYHFSFKKKRIPVSEILRFIGLEHASKKYISHFSSGMKQRAKLAQAFFSESEILLLDEPCTNLDEDGVRLYDQLLREFTNNRIVIVASNDEQEYRFCEHHIVIRDYKPQQTWS